MSTKINTKQIEMNEKQTLKMIIETPKTLSDEQKKAVLSGKRYVRIIAGAGTGKTETLTRRIAYLLLYHNVDPSSIVAFTFTEKAAQSMKSRIYERVKQLRGEKACNRLGEMHIGTIHGFCLRILEDYYGYGDHDVLDENQEMAFVLREGWKLGLGEGGRYAENCKNFIKSVNVVYDELIDRKKLKKKAADFCKRLESYEEILKRHRLLTFGQMVSLTVKILASNPEPIKHIQHLIVDEYQDINRAQEKLIVSIAKQANVFIVGDPRQSIYQWRGSDETCFENFVKIFPECETIFISENRRSSKHIVKIANAFADTFQKAQYKHIEPTKKCSGLCAKVEHHTPQEEAKWIISQIENYVNGGHCKYSDIAILLRSVTTSGGPFIDIMRERNIPYLVGGKVGLFRRDEARAVGKLFAWVWDDGFWIENPWNWSERTTGSELFKTGLQSWETVTGIPLSRHERKRLLEWKEKVLKGEFSNFTQIYQRLLTILGYVNLDPHNRMHAAIMANLGRFSTLLADYESSIRFGGSKPDWFSAIRGLCWYMNNYASGAYEEQPSEDIRGIDAVQIMTIHQAKGLEWPVVFIPCLVSRRFPSSKTGRPQEWFLPRNMFDVRRYEGETDDERRLFYVAITRAKDLLCLSYFKRINNSCSRSSFIESIHGLLNEVDSNYNLPMIEISPSHEEKEIQTFAAGEIITYLKCPYFYRLREIWHYKPELVIPLGYGKSLHYCLRCASDMIKGGANPEQSVEKVVRDKFHLPYAGGKVREKMQEKAVNTLKKFVRKHNKDMTKIKEVEARLEFPVQRATITGKVDVILRDENDIEIRDYKTSDEVTTPEQSALQVRLYTLGLRKTGTPVTRASLAYLEEAEVQPVTVGENEVEAARKIAENCIEGILNGKFTPNPGKFCKKCDYSQICKWQKKPVVEASLIDTKVAKRRIRRAG